MSAFEIVAHRGVSGDAPENNLQSFERAIELGADAVELDVRLTGDRVPVVCTDELELALSYCAHLGT